MSADREISPTYGAPGIFLTDASYGVVCRLNKISKITDTSYRIVKTSSQKLSNSHQLGPLVAVYRDRLLGWRDFFLFFLPASLAVLTPLGYGFWRGWYAQTRFGPALAENWQWPWFALSGLALIPLLWLALRRVRSAHRVITIYKDGVQI